MSGRIRLGISSCLLGENVRYDGGHKLDRFLRDSLGQFVDWIPVCPEVECGLPVTREAMRLVGSPDKPRLVTRQTGVDHTERMLTWARKRVKELEREALCGFVFKARSPSSGMRGVKIHSKSGMPSRTGSGLFAHEFMSRFPMLPVEDEDRMHDMGLRENFIERVFVYHRWQNAVRKGLSAKGLVDFHTRHKYLIMAHSVEHLRLLGKIVAGIKDRARGGHEEYLGTLMQGLQRLATARKNVNVLQHLMGYFKTCLAPDERQELLDVIGNYHKGFVPLIVPVTLIRHYVRKYDESYLEKQLYLFPHSAELMLRNHA